jgi:hypothetical protein
MDCTDDHYVNNKDVFNMNNKDIVIKNNSVISFDVNNNNIEYNYENIPSTPPNQIIKNVICPNRPSRPTKIKSNNIRKLYFNANEEN